MSPVLSQCPMCGVFPSVQFNISHAADVTFKGSKDQCPTCGRTADVLDGTFNFDARGFAEVLTAPDWTREAYADVHRILLNAHHQIRGGAPADVVLARASNALEEVRPGFGMILARMAGSPRLANLLAFLSLILPLILQMADDSVSRDEVQEMIDHAIVQYETSPTDPTSPVPSVNPADGSDHSEVPDSDDGGKND